MSNISPAWTVTKSGTPKTVQATGSKIVYNANSIARATMIFNNTDNVLNNFFSPEDEVQVKIGSQLMVVGFIEDLFDKRLKNREKELQLEIVDYGGYLASKTSFERDFKRSTLPDTILEIMAAEISGLTTNVTDLAVVAEKIKRNFIGTYVKDGWNAVVTNVDGDYYTDENKIFQAFAESTRELAETTTTNTWKITDQTPAAANEINPDYNFPLEYHQNAKDRYRSVIVTNNIKETYPNVVDLYQTSSYKDDENGKTFSSYYQTPGGFTNWDIDNTTRIPATFFPVKDVGGLGQTMPTIQIPVLSTSTPFNILLRGIEFGADGVTRNLDDIGINILDWQFFAMYVDNKLSRVSGSYTLDLQLIDEAGDFYEREIYDSTDLPNSDINSDFTFLEYDMPANLTDSVSNGWTKTGSPVKVDRIAIVATPTTNFNADDPSGTRSYMEFGKVHFFRRRRASETASGTPATEKVIIDSTAKSIAALEVLAEKEQLRANKISRTGFITIDGNTAFRNPAYIIDSDFTSSLGTGRSGLIRMDQIVHSLTNGIHKTRINFKPSNIQP